MVLIDIEVLIKDTNSTVPLKNNISSSPVPQIPWKGFISILLLHTGNGMVLDQLCHLINTYDSL